MIFSNVKMALIVMMMSMIYRVNVKK